MTPYEVVEASKRPVRIIGSDFHVGSTVCVHRKRARFRVEQVRVTAAGGLEWTVRSLDQPGVVRKAVAA